MAVTPFDPPYPKSHAASKLHHGVCFIEPGLLPIEVLYSRNMDFRPFCSRDLDLDPMTFICELDPESRIPWRYIACANMNILTYKAFDNYRLCRDIRPTDRHHRNYIPRRWLYSRVVKDNHVKFNKRVHGNIQDIQKQPHLLQFLARVYVKARYC